MCQSPDNDFLFFLRYHSHGGKNMDVWAHRGFSSIYPENTMMAFEKAVESGADGIEMDVHLSSDGYPVVIHDENLLRTGGIDRMVGECTLDELTHTVVSQTQGGRYNTTVPSFEEFCAFVKDTNTRADIELKTSVVYYPGIEEKVAALVKKYRIEDRVIFSSFNWLSLVVMKRLLPGVKCGLLFEYHMNARHLSFEVKEAGLDLLHPDFSCITDEMVREADENGVGINAWTINSEEELRKLIEWDVKGCITNSPDMALAVLGRFTRRRGF